jgi:hypothetical protein
VSRYLEAQAMGIFYNSINKYLKAVSVLHHYVMRKIGAKYMEFVNQKRFCLISWEEAILYQL